MLDFRLLAGLFSLTLVQFGCPSEEPQDDDTNVTDDDDDATPGDDDDDDAGDDDSGDDDAGDDDSANNGPRLLSLHEFTQQILEIDLQTGVATVLGGLDPSDALNTTVFGPDGQVWASDGADHELLRIDPCTGSITVVGSTGVGNVCGMSFGPGGLLYGLDTSTDHLVEIDVVTGAAVSIGPLGISLDTCGLAFDGTNQRLLGINGATNDIFTVDPLSGEAMTLSTAQVEFDAVGVEHDPVAQILLASDGTQLHWLNPDVGTTQMVGAFGYEDVNDLALFRGDWPCD